ncbi:hypothetical protein MasN3_41820 [Massilia varians]|uniref:Methyltransferase domain-containing protein n=1 Tax=Massilia varians TaxID=457921 RepID=A0ABM8CBN1_9BURK|nr:class I SAM-dependent methyltransferase [Massilia varians]BDT60688.1 hypothetical protein MasN3_41820 [Massilia varians]
MSNSTLLADETDEPALTEASAPGRWLSDDAIARIRCVDHFRNSEYAGLDLNAVIDSYVHNFVEPLLRVQPEPAVVADIGAGYGWLACAFALRTKARVVVVEYGEARLEAARRIAGILGVAERMEWINASIASLPIPDRSVDAAYCIEVIEHTGIDPAYLRELARITRDVLVITSPNKLFPVIGHDTELPFCHWLPLSARDVYARLFRRAHMQDNNLFWTPGRVFAALHDFRRTSSFLQFEDYAHYRTAQPHIGGRGGLLGLCKRIYFKAVAALGPYGIYVSPNIASTYRRSGD